MKYNIKQLLSKGVGTVFNSVNKNDINNLEIDVPDEDKQDKIALFLCQIDDKIEINEKINRKLISEEYKNQLINYYKDFEEEMLISDLIGKSLEVMINNFQKSLIL